MPSMPPGSSEVFCNNSNALVPPVEYRKLDSTAHGMSHLREQCIWELVTVCQDVNLIKLYNCYTEFPHYTIPI